MWTSAILLQSIWNYVIVKYVTNQNCNYSTLLWNEQIRYPINVDVINIFIQDWP